MPTRFQATREEIGALVRVVAEIPEIQRALVANHPALHTVDRAAHQQQVSAGKVVLRVEPELPPELTGVGLFVPGSEARGIGRISTGLGCPHLQTDPDFLGIMLAFQTPAKQRVDFLGINDAAAPTNTVEEFIALLVATAAAAGADVPFGKVGKLDLGNLTAAQAKLFKALRKRLGVMRATTLFLHLARQTARTAFSSSAIQQYWTGVVEAGDIPGKFSFVPTVQVNHQRALRPGERYLTEDWEQHTKAGDIELGVYWIPFRDDDDTPLDKLSEAWAEAHAVRVATATFLRSDPSSRESRLVAMLASEMGANPGHWVSTRAGETPRDFPGTRFTAARSLAYALSQRTRDALPMHAYQEFFETGQIGAELEHELVRRTQSKGQFPVSASPSLLR